MYHIKEDRRSRQSAAYFAEALVELAKTRPFAGISVLALAERAGLSRATFYRCFDAVDDVLRYLADAAFAELGAELAVYYRGEGGRRAGMRSVFLRPLLRYWADHRELLSTLLSAQRSDFLQEGMRALLEEVLARRRDPGPALGLRRDYFIALRSGQAVALLLHWQRQGMDLGAEELADLILAQERESFDLELDLEPETGRRPGGEALGAAPSPLPSGKGVPHGVQRP